jgi:hypothetical protein
VPNQRLRIAADGVADRSSTSEGAGRVPARDRDCDGVDDGESEGDRSNPRSPVEASVSVAGVLIRSRALRVAAAASVGSSATGLGVGVRSGTVGGALAGGGASGIAGRGGPDAAGRSGSRTANAATAQVAPAAAAARRFRRRRAPRRILS